MRRRGIALAASPAASLSYGLRGRLGALGRTDDEYVTRVAYDVRYGMVWADTGEKLSQDELDHYYQVLDARGFSRTSTPELVGWRWGIPSGFVASEAGRGAVSPTFLPGEWGAADRWADLIDGAGPVSVPEIWPEPAPSAPGPAARSWGWILAGALAAGALVAVMATRR